MNRLSIFAASVLMTVSAVAQTIERPKLVVGIVVDQMRWDYLYRYYNRYCEGGFKRLINEGFNCENTLLDYVPTVTAIGHSSIYTGSVPSIHGIAGNNFFKDGKPTYCTADSTVEAVGGSAVAGKMSPRNLLSTTIGDELHLATNFRSKVISVSLKDRASILPGGHTANGVYWFDAESGNFMTSSYYRKTLPSWLVSFNSKKLATHYLRQDWNTLYPIETYAESTADNTNFERPFDGKTPVTPVPTSALMETKGLGVIRNTPYGNTLTLNLAEAAIEGEKLGQGEFTDLLAVSLSSTDYVGHQFGTYAVETEDTYLRLDKDLAEFFTMLDSKVGRGNYLVFLTADHAATHNFGLMQQHEIPAGGVFDNQIKSELNACLKKQLGVGYDLVKAVMNYQVFLDNGAIEKNHVDRNAVIDLIMEALKSRQEVAYAVDEEKIVEATIPSVIKEKLINGYFRGRSGDIQFVMQPGWYSAEDDKGTEHGVWNPYDAHVPLLFMGWNVAHGSTFRKINFTDIAPTICAMLHIQSPDGCIGNPILDITDHKNNHNKQ